MALIGEIRQRSWILIVFIGLGMGGFLLMDMLQNDTKMGGGSNNVGEIAGTDISITEFQRRQEQLYANSAANPYQVRDAVWQYYIREAVIQNEAEAMGLGVSEDELNELMYNVQSLSPLIRQALGGQTGQVDPNQLAQIRQQVESGELPADQLFSWNNLMEQVKLERLESKINGIAAAAIYAPSWMAEMMHNVNNQKADFRFVAVPYSTVKDEEIEVSDKELKAYINENKGKFLTEEEARKFSYVLFDVKPTLKDSTDIVVRLNEQITDWTGKSEDISDSSFIAFSLNGVYSEEYVAKDKLAPQIADTIAQIPVGTIIAPYVDGSTYKIAKLIGKQIVPDSVKARHILRRVDQQGDPSAARAQYLAADALIDSLMTELNDNNANFDSLAAQYGQDDTNVKGGDLGVFGPGAMVPEFNNLAFYTGKIGTYYKVNTQLGVHIMQVQNKYSSGKLGYKVGYLLENIIPSQETEKDVLRIASKFAATLTDLKDFEAKAKEAGFEVQSSIAGARRNDYRIIGIGEGEGAREIIKWSYDADKGDISNEVYTFENKGGAEIFIEKYAVIGLQSIVEEGMATISDPATRLQAENGVKNHKKAAVIMAKIDEGQTLDAIASANSAQVQTASQVSMGTTTVPGMGNEPKVVGKVFNIGTKTNTVSEPIEGNTAIYYIEVTFKPEATTPADLPTAKQQASAQSKQQIGSRLFEALRKQTEVYDYRYRFF